MKRHIFLKIIFTLTLLLELTTLPVYSQDETSAVSSYNISKDSIKAVYNSILRLSESNQNTDSYIDKINELINYQNLAYQAINEKKYAESLTYSKEANELAIDLLNLISDERSSSILSNPFFSLRSPLLSSLVLTLVFLMLWSLLNSKYYNTLLKSKPEVRINES